MKDWYQRTKREAGIDKLETNEFFSECCWGKNKPLPNTEIFNVDGTYLDLGICPSCRKKCKFIPMATKSELETEFGI